MKGLILTGFCLLFSSHPFYVGKQFVNYRQSQQQVVVSFRLFADDLSDALRVQDGQMRDLLQPSILQNSLAQIQAYFAAHTLLNLNDQPVALPTLSCEGVGDAINCSGVIPFTEKLKKLSVQNELLLELFATQKHIVQCEIEGEKQMLLLEQGKSQANLQFN